MGYRHPENNPPAYAWMQEFEPSARIGYSLWVFELSADDVAEFRGRHVHDK
jgi:hypothetical protein